MSLRSRIAGAVVVSSILCAGASASAQITEKEAQRRVAAASRDGLADFKRTLKALRAEVEASLDTFEIVLAGAPQPFDALDLFDDLAETQDEIQVATSEAYFSIYVGATLALTDLRGGGPSLAGIYPAGFYGGDGGTIDRHLAQVTVQWDRFYARLAKRLARTRKLAERNGLGLTVVLARSGAPPAANFGDASVIGSSGSRPLTVDTLVAASVLANANDAVLAIGGQGDDAFGGVAASIDGADAVNLTDTLTPDASNERWSGNTVSDFAMAGLPEGSFRVTARQGTGPLAEAIVGVR